MGSSGQRAQHWFSEPTSRRKIKRKDESLLIQSPKFAPEEPEH
jgi:hypothetical protein